MIRSKKYKYIRNFNSVEVVEQNLGDNEFVNAFIRMGAQKDINIPFEELFDIEKDPYEQVNLAKDPKYMEIKEKLASDMFIWMKEQGDILSDTLGYMPILHAPKHKLDKSSKFKKVSKELEGTLKKEDYLILHY